MIESALYGINREFIEELYQRFLQDPSTVDKQWHSFFKEYQDVFSGPSLKKPLPTDDGSIPFPSLPPKKGEKDKKREETTAGTYNMECFFLSR